MRPMENCGPDFEILAKSCSDLVSANFANLEISIFRNHTEYRTWPNPSGSAIWPDLNGFGQDFNVSIIIRIAITISQRVVYVTW